MKNLFKKFKYNFFLIIFFFLIIIIFNNTLLRWHYNGVKRFNHIQNILVFFSELPVHFKNMIVSNSINPSKPKILNKHKEKNSKIFIPNNRNGLLILPRYIHNLSMSVIDIIDLENFQTIHSYKINPLKIFSQVKNNEEFPKLKIDDAPIRFEYRHPILLNDGSIIADSDYSVAFKIDLCSKLIWVNDEEIFHHSKEFDHEGNIWIPSQMNPKSKYVKKYSVTNYQDDSIVKINTDGEIIFKKSVTELLIENKILPENFVLINDISHFDDPIHLNDIQPVIMNSKNWKIGDLFLSLRNQSSIVHYRPSSNKIIKYITGPFSMQHDVDIVSDKEISIFNNNNFLKNAEYSEILLYNYETNKFRKILNKQLQNENFKTTSQGLSHFFKDGSLLVEEQNHGRIIIFNNKGEKELEFINKDTKGRIGFISWSRIIEDKDLIKEFKTLLNKKQCTN